MFFSRKIAAEELFCGGVDCHSHILPGVDDGVRSVDEALQILNYYEKLGVKKVILTPHVMEDLPRNNKAFLNDEFAKLKTIYSGGVELSLGAEYMLDSGFTKYLRSGDLLTIFDNYLLVEMSCVDAMVRVVDVIPEIINCGYFVVLAHPERYLYLDEREFTKLKEMGVRFQLNIPSVLGSYGHGVRKLAEQMLKMEYYDLLGSDIHSFAYHSNLLKGTRLSAKIANQIRSIKSLL